jgi:hypothetical protein
MYGISWNSLATPAGKAPFDCEKKFWYMRSCRESEIRRTRQCFIVSWLLPYRAAHAKETKL